jgi:RNA polymerase sigma-70 factor (ECF subfamily)
MVNSTPANRRTDQPTPLSLLQRARNREEDAWRRLVALYRPLVLFWCSSGGVPAGDVEDVAQDVFACVARDLIGFRRDRPGDTFRGWLRVVTRNQVLRYFRDKKDEPIAEGGSSAFARFQELPDAVNGPEEGEAAQMSQLYRQALEQVRIEFEQNTWRAFWLTVIEGRAPAALTTELGMSVAAIRQAKSRVMRRIKTELGELLE